MILQSSACQSAVHPLTLAAESHMKIWLDGKLVDESEAKISVFDHGLLYGDGVFEGIRFYNGRVFRLEEHIRRLFDSSRAIILNLPWTQEEVCKFTCETVAANGLTDGYIRLVVTRGAGELGLNPYLCPRPSMFIIASTIKLYPDEHYQNGLSIITCATRRPAPGALMPQVKSLNYLNNIMAKVEAIQANALEAVMLNEQGYVAECTGDNLFLMKNGTLLTPLISDGALDGITRAVIIELAGETRRARGREDRSPVMTSSPRTNVSSPAPPRRSSRWWRSTAASSAPANPGPSPRVSSKPSTNSP